VTTVSEDEGVGWVSVDEGEMAAVDKPADSEVATLDANLVEVVLLSTELG